MAVKHIHQASTPGPLHLLFLYPVSTLLLPPLPRPLFKFDLLQKPFLVSQKLPASGSLLFLSKLLGWGPGPSPMTQNLDMLPGLCWVWAGSRGGRRCLAVPGTEASARVLPWEATLSVRPGFRGTGGKAQRPPTQAHLASLTVKPGSSGPHVDSCHWPILCCWPTSLPNLRSPALCS